MVFDLSSRTKLDRAREVLTLEANGLLKSAKFLDGEFLEALEILNGSSGKIVTTGVGKSGLVARKVAATLNSTGSPALYLSPINALHGDIGVVQEGDVGLFFSKSGHSRELEEVLRAFTIRNVPNILVTAAEAALLGDYSTAVVRIADAQEACPFDLAPTTSTISLIGIGDALAILLMEGRGFDADDFALNHPSGSIGRRLTMRVEDLMVTGEEIPTVALWDKFRAVILEMTQKRQGATCVVRGQTLVGIITDGDLRRKFGKIDDVESMFAENMMSPEPMAMSPGTAAREALQLLEETKRSHLPIVDGNRLVGFLHLHHLVEAGL